MAGWDNPTKTLSNVRWERECWEALKPFYERSAYVNDLGDEGEQRVRETFGKNYECRLALNTIRPISSIGIRMGLRIQSMRWARHRKPLIQTRSCNRFCHRNLLIDLCLTFDLTFPAMATSSQLVDLVQGDGTPHQRNQSAEQKSQKHCGMRQAVARRGSASSHSASVVSIGCEAFLKPSSHRKHRRFGQIRQEQNSAADRSGNHKQRRWHAIASG
jgi:hypothetical protein